MGELLEYETCKKCGIQQERKQFLCAGIKRDICKFCRKTSPNNPIPNQYKQTTKDALDYLKKIVFDPKNEASIFLQTQMDPVFVFLERQHCREMELKEQNK